MAEAEAKPRYKSELAYLHQDFREVNKILFENLRQKKKKEKKRKENFRQNE